MIGKVSLTDCLGERKVSKPSQYNEWGEWLTAEWFAMTNMRFGTVVEGI